MGYTYTKIIVTTATYLKMIYSLAKVAQWLFMTYETKVTIPFPVMPGLRA